MGGLIHTSANVKGIISSVPMLDRSLGNIFEKMKKKLKIYYYNKEYLRLDR